MRQYQTTPAAAQANAAALRLVTVTEGTSCEKLREMKPLVPVVLADMEFGAGLDVLLPAPVFASSCLRSIVLERTKTRVQYDQKGADTSVSDASSQIGTT